MEIADRNNYNKVKALSFNYLGIINYFTNNLTEAEELTLKGLALSEKENFYKGKSLANEHLCIIKIKQKKFQEALNYNNNSYKISLENDDIVNIPAVFYNFSIIYNLLGEYDKAIEYSFKALDIEKSFNNSKGQANEFVMIGRILQNKGDFDGSKKYLHKAYEIYKELKSLRHLIFVLRALSSAYEITGNYKLALLYFKELTTYNDSMFNEKVKREVALSNTKRSLKEKEEKIALLEKTNELNKSVQRYLTFIIFFTLFSFFIISILYLKILKSREETLKINENLVKLNNERQKFFSIISHDLKSPLLGILGLIEIIKEKLSYSDNDEIKSMFNKLENAVNNQFKLVENLLSWSSLQTERIQKKPVKIDLNRLIDEVAETLSSFANRKSIEIIKEFENGITVYADRDMIFSALMNLVSNAIKFSHKNSQIIICTGKVNEDFAWIQIIDFGQGIKEELKDKVFSLSHNITTEGTEKEKGTGLGLLLVKEMIERNNGEIDFTSQENVGTSFRVILPISKN